MTAHLVLIPAEDLAAMQRRLDQIAARLDEIAARDDGWMAPDEYARLACVSPRTVERRIADGTLEARGAGRGRMVRRR